MGCGSWSSVVRLTLASLSLYVFVRPVGLYKGSVRWVGLYA